MGYVALTMRPRPSNYSVGHKRLEPVPSNSSNNQQCYIRVSPGILQKIVEKFCIILAVTT